MSLFPANLIWIAFIIRTSMSEKEEPFTCESILNAAWMSGRALASHESRKFVAQSAEELKGRYSTEGREHGSVVSLIKTEPIGSPLNQRAR